MWVLLLGLFLWGFLGTITDGPKRTQSMSTLRMYLHECLSRNVWHLHPYHFSFLSIISLVHSHHRQNQRLNFFWSQSTITILCIIDIILLTSMAVVTALINVLGYNRLVSGGNKTLCKHNREPPYLPATMSIRVKMMGETIFWKSVNQTFLFQYNETKWKIRRLLVQQTIVLHFLVFRVTTCKIQIWRSAPLSS